MYWRHQKKKFLLHQTLQGIVSSETSGACSWFAETSTAKILSWRLCWVACNAPAYMHMTIRDNSMIKSTSCNRFCFHLRNADEQRGHYTAMESFIVSNHTFSHWYMSWCLLWKGPNECHKSVKIRVFCKRHEVFNDLLNMARIGPNLPCLTHNNHLKKICRNNF